MRQKSRPVKEPAEHVVKDIRRARRQFSAEEKIRIVLEGLRGEESIAELCRREDRPEPLLSLVKGLPRSRQETAGWRHGVGRDLGRSQGPSPRGVGLEGGCGRTDTGKPSAQKKHDRGWGGRGMRYPASEKAEIIRLVEQSPQPVQRTLEKLGIPRATFVRWRHLCRRGRGPHRAGSAPRTSA